MRTPPYFRCALASPFLGFALLWLALILGLPSVQAEPARPVQASVPVQWTEDYDQAVAQAYPDRR